MANKQIQVIVLLLLLLIAGCKKSAVSTEQSKDSIEQLKETATQITPSGANDAGVINKTKEAVNEFSQTVFVPVQPQASMPSGDGVISQSYQPSCFLSKFSGLNKACGARNFWHQESTLMSWYIPYRWIVLALIIILFVVWWIRRGA